MNTLLTLLTTLLAVVDCQQTYTINPKNVPLSLRQNWCQSQETQCPLICLQTPGNTAVTQQNACNATTLTYACICSNGQSPNLTQYSQTLPFYICQEWGNECVHNCGSDASCASACRQDHPCGAQHPKPPNKTVESMIQSSKSAAATAKGTKSQGIHTGFAGQGTASASTGKGAAGRSASMPVLLPAMMEFGHGFGMILVVATFFLGFAVLL